MRRARRRHAIGAAAAAPIWLVIAGLVLAALAVPAAGSAEGGGLCPVLDLVPPLACRADATPGRTQSDASSAQASAQADQVRQTSTAVRYDLGRIAVTFARGVKRARIDAVFARAGVTLEQAVPAIRAYMVTIEPNRRNSALASLRASSGAATAGQEVPVVALDAAPPDAHWSRPAGAAVPRL